MPLATWLCEQSIQSLPISFDARHDCISSWLSHAPSPPLSATYSGKRKRSHIKQGINVVSARNSSPSKRRRSKEHSSSATEDVENTPRAKSKIAIEPPPPSTFTTSSAPSSHSHRSTSPRKKQALRKMAKLSLLPNPVIMKSIDDATATPPDELVDIALRLRRIGRGLGVISRSERVGACLCPNY